MRWPVKPVAVVTVTAAVTVAGCSQTVSGTALRAESVVPDSNRSYAYVDDRCGLLVDGSIQQAIGADHVVRPYSGAVCQYVLARGSAMVDVTFSWYETGSLDRERSLATERGATVTEKVVERHQAFLARRDTTGAACSATAAAGTGVLSWWVQFRGQHNGDPCKDAEKLLTATLQSDM
ncbi:DUF3558 domain-containing protein [Mycolicibacterium moriokaense]|uniref:Uncharacterized protein DUF3558 n=1 Tax=Mycolicibacterium moriokaense TaxID=39691 RepID=A0A318HAK6_9MYCO|nr:DUF3558 domain-containing protein [Mycolicibacterium moriokaense]PXX00817.1 uncharacterized protein DUF3558 [Mycolicibacterium moriokaense]